MLTAERETGVVERMTVKLAPSLPSEDGDVFVVKAGPHFELLQKNEMGEPLMATPAISGGMLLVRTQHRLSAVGAKGTF